MTVPDAVSPAVADQPACGKQPSFFRLAQKELRETLRDRRTLLTLILMPLLVYPLLSLGFRSFLASGSLKTDDDGTIRYRIGIHSTLTDEALVDLLRQVEQGAGAMSNIKPYPETAEDPLAHRENPARRIEAPLSHHRWFSVEHSRNEALILMEQGELDLYVELERGDGLESAAFRWNLFFDPTVPTSRNAARLVREHLELFNRLVLENAVRAIEIAARSPMAVQQFVLQLRIEGSQGPNVAALIPLILVLMTITGAVYPAIDLTAGERERGTLETLMAAPIPRMRILVAKLMAVLTVSVLTAVLNLLGMLGTIWAFGLEKTLFGDTVSFAMLLKVLGLLVLFAMFFSAIMLVITSYARSFKEAQAYLIPLILLSLGPGLMTLTPGMELTGPWPVVPMVNILLLARDVLQGQVALVPAFVTIVSTAIYAAAAISLAASIFGSDSILYGGQTSWSEMFMRPGTSRPLASPQTALFCLLFLFPLNFVLIGVLSRIETSMSIRLVWMSCFTLFAFFVVPSLMAIHQRIQFTSGFGWRTTRWGFIVGAIVLGLSLWPLVMSLLAGWQQAMAWLLGEDAARSWADRLVEFSRGHVERFRDAPWALILLAFAIVPAVCEEWFFRGMLLRSLLSSGRPVRAIVFSALAFGAFHTLSGGIAMFDRFLTTSLVGLILGWIAYRADSILPSVLLHAVHNAIVFGLAYFHRELSALPGFPAEGEPVPVIWVLIAGAASALTILVLELKVKARPTGTGEPGSFVN